MAIELEHNFFGADGWEIWDGVISARYTCPDCGDGILVNDDWPTEAKCRCRSYRLVVAVKLETWGEE